MNGYKLRDYQEEAVSVVNSLPSGSRQVVAISTGLGKTVIGSHFAFRKRLLWLSHRDELVHQPEKYFTSQGYRFGVDQAEEHPEPTDQVVSASIMTISKTKRLHAYAPDEFDLIVVDEMQHSAAPTYRKVLNYFKPDKVIGLTATPQRGDGVRLDDIFDGICYKKTLQWGIKNHWLCDLRYIRVQAQFDMKKVKKQMGDFSAKDLTREMANSNNAAVVAKAYKDYCLSDKSQTLIYCPTVSISRAVLQEIKKILPKRLSGTVAQLDANTDKLNRRTMLEDFKKGTLHCIINCMVLTEGTDLPNTNTIILDRPTANQTLFTQIAGRGTRKYPGKDHCLLVDIVGANSENRNVVNAFSLFGIDSLAVPEKIRNRAAVENMSELADSLSGTIADLPNYLKLQCEMIDIFTGSFMAMIDNNKEKGVRAVSSAFESYLSNQKELLKDKGLDFQDLVVRVMPSELRKYQIQASYNGYIYLSEPDAVGRTIISFDFSREKRKDYYPEYSKFDGIQSTPIIFEDAIQIIKDYLYYLVPKYNAFLWSETERSLQKKQKISSRQKEAIEETFDCIDTKGSSRLDASNMFSIADSIKAAKKQGKEYKSLLTMSQKSPSSKEFTDWQSAFIAEKTAEKDETETKVKAEKWEECRKIIENTKRHKLAEAKKWADSFDSSGRRTMLVKASEAANKKASYAQISYIRSLVGSANISNNRVILDLDDLPKVSITQASTLISVLLKLKDQEVPSEMVITTNLNQYIADDTALQNADGTAGTLGSTYIDVEQKLIK